MAENLQLFPYLFSFMKNMSPSDFENILADEVLVLLLRDASN